MGGQRGSVMGGVSGRMPSVNVTRLCVHVHVFVYALVKNTFHTVRLQISAAMFGVNLSRYPAGLSSHARQKVSQHFPF